MLSCSEKYVSILCVSVGLNGEMVVFVAYGLSMNSGSNIDVLPYPDYSPMGNANQAPTLDSPAAGQFTNIAGPPLDSIYSSNLQVRAINCSFLTHNLVIHSRCVRHGK